MSFSDESCRMANAAESYIFIISTTIAHTKRWVTHARRLLSRLRLGRCWSRTKTAQSFSNCVACPSLNENGKAGNNVRKLAAARLSRIVQLFRQSCMISRPLPRPHRADKRKISAGRETSGCAWFVSFAIWWVYENRRCAAATKSCRTAVLMKAPARGRLNAAHEAS
jgi:hypothetical protein